MSPDWSGFPRFAAVFALVAATLMAGCPPDTTDPECVISLEPSERVLSEAGGDVLINVNAPSACAWSAVSNAAWIIFEEETTGTGTGLVRYRVLTNTGPDRTGMISVGGQTHLVSQRSGCVYSIDVRSLDYAAAGGDGAVRVTAPVDCPWTVRSNDPWITLTSAASGTGGAVVTYRVEELRDQEIFSRTGSLTIAGQVHTVNQRQVCTFNIAPSSRSFPSGGGGGARITVTTGVNCDWTAASNVSWIRITAGTAGRGSGAVEYTVDASNGPARTGSILAAGALHTVEQEDGCAFSIPESRGFTAEGGPGQVDVVTGAGCQWAATSSVAWIQLTNGNAGSGRGAVRYVVLPNLGPERTGAVTVAGKTHTIVQQGASVPTADFLAQPQSGDAPLRVQFTDTSSAGQDFITNWLWDFGDGATSLLRDPQHTYAERGTYSVSLLVTTSVGARDRITKENFINAGPVTTVTTLDDVQDADSSAGIAQLNAAPGPDGRISLREALNAANRTSGAKTINFALEFVGESIFPVSALPPLEEMSGGITLNGRGQITLDGSLLNAGEHGLVLLSGSNVVSGLGIHSFPGFGILLTGPDAARNTVRACTVGTEGFASLGNGFGGIAVQAGASRNTIGGSSPDARNVVSGNRGPGILIEGAATNGNEFAGNYIGTNNTGAAALANTQGGVVIRGGATGNVVGGSGEGARNVISGNSQPGVVLSGAFTSGNTVAGNHIGVNAAGDAALPNLDGVSIRDGASGNIVGGGTPGERNILSGNRVSGIMISDAATSGNVVRGNYIGTNAAGTAALPNREDGVRLLFAASGNVIGGVFGTEGNLISGNAFNGIELENAGTSGNRIEGNLIGTNGEGRAALPNGTNGIRAALGVTGNIIGGDATLLRNVVSGNAQFGVLITDEGTGGNRLFGNHIGANIDNSAAIPNGAGIQIINGARNNTIGGLTPALANVVRGNNGHGIEINGENTSGNGIRGNAIFQNALKGIAIANQGNTDILPPTITKLTLDSIGGTVRRGVSVDVFVDDDDEGRLYLFTTPAGGMFGRDFDFRPHVGRSVTATVTNLTNGPDGPVENTSEFSTPVFIAQPPVITRHPRSIAVIAGNPAVFSIDATSTSALQYQWSFASNGSDYINLADGGIISGVHAATLTISAAQRVNAGDYRCTVFNDLGQAVSLPATLSVAAPAKSR